MKPILPEQLATGLESGEQKALMQWCALNYNKYPQLKWLYHIPNGGYRNKREASNLKAMGVKPGVPDLHLPIKIGQWSGLYIELKKVNLKPRDGKNKKKRPTSLEQDEWLAHLQSQGYGCMVCYGWIEARDVLIQYLEWKE